MLTLGDDRALFWPARLNGADRVEADDDDDVVVVVGCDMVDKLTCLLLISWRERDRIEL